MIRLDAKQTFANAIVELAKTKPFEKITIQNIADYCDASRQTFYHHFKDKEDLIEYVYISDERKALEKVKADCSLKERAKAIFDTFIEKRSFYIHAYQYVGQNSLSDNVFTHYYNFYLQIITERYGDEVLDEKMKASIRFLCYGSIDYVKEWMRQGMNTSSEEMAEIMVDNIPERMRNYLK